MHCLSHQVLPLRFPFVLVLIEFPPPFLPTFFFFFFLRHAEHCIAGVNESTIHCIGYSMADRFTGYTHTRYHFSSVSFSFLSPLSILRLNDTYYLIPFPYSFSIPGLRALLHYSPSTFTLLLFLSSSSSSLSYTYNHLCLSMSILPSSLTHA